jgi:hypothetical protein
MSRLCHIGSSMPGRLLLMLVCFAVGMSACAGCIERLAPGDVAAGVSRLTIRNAGYLSKLVLNDASCGFASPAVQRAALVQGQPGGPGAVTWKVSNCTIDLATAKTFDPDCTGVSATLKGKITVSATQRILGTITGNSETPVIPAGADAVRLEFDVTNDNLSVTKSNSPSSLTLVSGALHFVLQPRIALSKSLGVCAVQTLDFSFSEVRYQDAKVILAKGDHVFPVDVPSAQLVAQSGKWQGEENSFSGEVKVWDTTVTLPLASDPDGLDPDYTPQSYLDSIACDPDLVVPVSYACPSLKEQLVQGVSKLTVKELGALASLVNADTRCGFSSPQVLASAVTRGNAGSAGSVVFTLPAPCVFAFPMRSALGTDCTGKTQFAEGTVTITGTQTLTGVLTGDTRQPVAPDARDPAELSLVAKFANFRLSDSVGGQALLTKQGTLTGVVRPRVALDRTTGICSNTTSIAEFPSIAWQDAALGVTVSGFDFQVDVSQASLQAQSGTNGTRSNFLSGTVISDGQPIAVPPRGASPVLDPTFDEAAFTASFACAPGFALASTDADCSLDRALATNAARLTVQAAGAVASMIQNDSQCGFSALGVKTSPTTVVGNNGQQGSIQWDLQGCQLGATGTFSRGKDCAGNESFVTGKVTVAARRVVTGLRNTAYVIFDSIVPNAPNSLTITLRDVQLNEFSAWTLPVGETEPVAELVIHHGTLSGVVTPVLGERRSKPGVFDIGTPVARFEQLQLQNATATLSVGGKRFELNLPALSVNALNGTVQGLSNALSGQVVLRTDSLVSLAPTALDPSFTQATFDQSYACTPDLKATVPAP